MYHSKLIEDKNALDIRVKVSYWTHFPYQFQQLEQELASSNQKSATSEVSERRK